MYLNKDEAALYCPVSFQIADDRYDEIYQATELLRPDWFGRVRSLDVFYQFSEIQMLQDGHEGTATPSIEVLRLFLKLGSRNSDVELWSPDDSKSGKGLSLALPVSADPEPGLRRRWDVRNWSAFHVNAIDETLDRHADTLSAYMPEFIEHLRRLKVKVHEHSAIVRRITCKGKIKGLPIDYEVSTEVSPVESVLSFTAKSRSAEGARYNQVLERWHGTNLIGADNVRRVHVDSEDLVLTMRYPQRNSSAYTISLSRIRDAIL